jgi:hypothetical protein
VFGNVTAGLLTELTELTELIDREPREKRERRRGKFEKPASYPSLKERTSESFRTGTRSQNVGGRLLVHRFDLEIRKAGSRKNSLFKFFKCVYDIRLQKKNIVARSKAQPSAVLCTNVEAVIPGKFLSRSANDNIA